jgi:hypothetical protein
MILLKINLSSTTFEIIDVKSNLIMMLKAYQFKCKLRDTKAINRSLFVLIGFQKKRISEEAKKIHFKYDY